MSDFKFFMPIAKIDKENQTVSGYASTPAKDSDGEIITLDAVREALPDYMRWGNIREMHKLSAVGTAQEANMDAKGLFITAKIVDPLAWEKCVEGVYKGFSIGGRKVDKSGNKITEIEMTEISVVDRPANPQCNFALAKSAKTTAPEDGGYLIKIGKTKQSPETKALRKMAKIVGDLAKGGPPAAHDGFSLPAKTGTKELGPNDANPAANETRKAGGEGGSPCEPHGKINCEKCAAEKAAGGGTGDKSKKPYGDVDYADPGTRADGKHRYPIDNEEHVRAAWNYINKPKNQAKYPDGGKAVKSKVVAAWKSKVHKDGPPGAEEKPTTKAVDVLDLYKTMEGFELPDQDFLNLRKTAKGEPLAKGMGAAGSLSYVFDSIRNAQRSLLMEGKREGGDMKDKGLATTLGQIAEQLAGVISQKAQHEGAEAKTLTDADDIYLVNVLGEEFSMAEGGDGALARTVGGDPLANAILDMVKRAAAPSRNQRMAMANDDVKKARKAMKEAREAVEDCHKLHKAAFLNKASKATKGDKGGDNKDDEFDHTGAMEKLQKAFGAIEKARVFGKAAMGQMAKAAGRSGQQGQEAGDAEPGFYEVPSGVTDLSPGKMARLGPGGSAQGSTPPEYPVDGGTYAGKAAGMSDLQKFAKNGMVPIDVMQLIMEKATAAGELEALRRLPAASLHGGRSPMSFDARRVFEAEGGQSGGHSSQELNKALFAGVDVNALNGQDEHAHTTASARVIGNFIASGHFAKSIMDPAFNGMAGLKAD